MNKPNHIMAFLWKTDSSIFYVDDGSGLLAYPQAYAPYSLRHPLNQSGHNIPVDQNHELDVDGATASIWHTDTHMLGMIRFSDVYSMTQIVNRMASGELAAISPEIDHIENTFVQSEDEHVKLVTSARVKRISLVKRSANPDARAWVQSWELREKPFVGYDRAFEKDWETWVTAHDQDPARAAQASINARNIRERYGVA